MNKQGIQIICAPALLSLLLNLVTIPLWAQSDLIRQGRIADSLYAQSGDFNESASLFHSLGSAWEALGQIDSAEHKYLYEIKSLGQANRIDEALIRCAERLEKSKNQSNSNPYLVDLYYEKGYCELVMGDREASIQSLTTGLAAEQLKPEPDSLMLANMMQFKGLAMAQSGDVDKGEEILLQSHELRLEVQGPDHIDVASSANTLFMLYDQLEAFQKAHDFIGEAYRIVKLQKGENHPFLAMVLNNYSNARLNIGDPLGNRDLLLEAIRINEANNRPFLLAMNYYNLGFLYQNMGLLDLSLDYYQQSLKLSDTILPNPSVERANLYDGFGSVYFRNNQWKQAERFFEKGLDQHLQLNGKTSIEVAQSMHNLALINREKGNKKRASEQFDQAISLRENRLGPNHSLSLQSRAEEAEIKWQNGEKMVAIKIWRSLIPDFQKQLGKGHPILVKWCLRLAQAYYERGDTKTGVEYLNLTWEAIFFKEKSKQNTIQCLHPVVFEVVAFRLEQMLKHGNHSIESSDQTLQQFEDFLLRILPIFNQPEGDETLLNHLKTIYATSAFIAHFDQKAKPDEKAKFLLKCLENSRAFTVRLAQSKQLAIQFADIPDSLLMADQYLQARLWAINAQAYETESMNESIRSISMELNQEWQQLQVRLERDYPDYYALRYQVPTIDVNALNRKLRRSGQTILAYFVLHDRTLAFTYSGKELQSRVLQISDSEWQGLTAFISLISSFDRNDLLAEQAFLWYQKLVYPFEDFLSSNLLIFPDGGLYGLNFESLIQKVASPSQGYHEWNWLIRDFEIQYANRIPTSEKTTTNQHQVLAMAPGFSESLKSDYLKKMNPGDAIDSVFLNWFSTPWSVAFVESMEQSGWAKALTGESASTQNFKSLASEAQILHLATHARVDESNPLNSYLMLSPHPENQDLGYLFAKDLYAYQFDAPLVVLGACQTGLGQYRQGDGVLSLAHAFQYAGSSNLVYSLWNIDDQQSNWLMQSFYEQLNQGLSVQTALRTSKLEYLNQFQHDLAHPFYWSGMVSMGESIRFQNGKSWWPLYLLFGVLFCLFSFWMIKKTSLSR